MADEKQFKNSTRWRVKIKCKSWFPMHSHIPDPKKRTSATPLCEPNCKLQFHTYAHSIRRIFVHISATIPGTFKWICKQPRWDCLITVNNPHTTGFFSIKTKIIQDHCVLMSQPDRLCRPKRSPFPPPLHHLSVPQEPSPHVDRRLRGDNMSRGNMSRGYSPLLSWATAKSQGVVEVSNDPQNCRLD